MEVQALRAMLEKVRSGQMSIEHATEALAASPFADLGFAKLDTHRSIRKGFPEVVFCEGKQPSHAVEIIARLAAENGRVLGTRVRQELYDLVRMRVPGARYHEVGRCLVIGSEPPALREGGVLVVFATR